MKSAGKRSLEVLDVARAARGTGRTASSPSRTTRRSPRARAASASPHSAHGKVTSSTNGRWGSLERDARELVQLGERADRLHVLVRAAPHRQRRAPVALARQRPVDVALEPVAEAPVLDVLGVPVDRLVGGQQPVLDLAGGDVPGRLGVVEQRRAAAPAVRIGVLVASRRAAAGRARAGPRSGRGRRP